MSSTIVGKSLGAKKYIAKISTEEPTDDSHNDDFVVSAGSSLKKLSLSAGSIAASFRETLAAMNRAIDESVGEGTSKGSSGTKFSDVDLVAFQKTVNEDALARITTNDAHVSREMAKSIEGNVSSGIHKSSFARKSDVPSQINRAVPEIDYIDMLIGKRGMNDRFTARIVFSLRVDVAEEENVRAFRIFKAEVDVKQKNPTLGLNGLLELLSPSSLGSRKRNDQSLLFASRRFKENNIDNFLSKTTSVDGITGLIVGLTKNSGSLSTTATTSTGAKSSDTVNSQQLKDYVTGLQGVDILDRSVINDLNSIRNLQINSKSSIATIFSEESGKAVLNADTIDKVNSAHRLNLRDGLGVKSDLVASVSSNFKAIGMVSLDKIKKKSLPGFVEFQYHDDTVEYGKTYIYYVVSVNAEMVESSRSKLTRFSVVNNIPPGPPSNVVVKNDANFVTLSITKGEGKSPIEKFEVYRKDLTSLTREDDHTLTTVSNNDGFIVDTDTRSTLKNGFVQVSEVLNSRFGGAFFRDTTAVKGKKYVYRVYSVDIFGNKSHEPKEIEFLFNERNSRVIDLKRPTIITEIDARTNHAKVTVISDDNRIVGLFIGRRDLSIHQDAFTVPGQPSHMKFGNKFGSKIFDDTVLRSKEANWSGYFSNVVGENVVFLDQTTRVDHTYQYNVYGVDRFGNKTSSALSRALFISLRPKVNEPINFSGATSSVSGSVIVELSWTDGNIEIEAEEKLGNKTELEDSSVRTLYQIERKLVDGEIWEQFPLTEKKSLIDTSGFKDEIREKFMPPFLKVDTNYLYRVAAYQTGGFISNFTSPINVSTFSNVKSPTNFRITTVDTKVNPFYVVLNWDDDVDTGTIDKWIIERAVVNNFAASKINLSTNALPSLNFQKMKTVFREASRSVSRDLDKFFSDSDKLFVGQHFVVDDGVTFGNTYYYKIVSVGLTAKNISAPVYKGISVTDALFDSKLSSVLTQREKNRLVATPSILKVRKKLLRSH